MIRLVRRIRAHKFEAHLLAFLLIALSAGLMYHAAEREAITWIWILISIVVLGNILALMAD